MTNAVSRCLMLDRNRECLDLSRFSLFPVFPPGGFCFTQDLQLVLSCRIDRRSLRRSSLIESDRIGGEARYYPAQNHLCANSASPRILLRVQHTIRQLYIFPVDCVAGPMRCEVTAECRDELAMFIGELQHQLGDISTLL